MNIVYQSLAVTATILAFKANSMMDPQEMEGGVDSALDQAHTLFAQSPSWKGTGRESFARLSPEDGRALTEVGCNLMNLPNPQSMHAQALQVLSGLDPEKLIPEDQKRALPVLFVLFNIPFSDQVGAHAYTGTDEELPNRKAAEALVALLSSPYQEVKVLTAQWIKDSMPFAYSLELIDADIRNTIANILSQ
ncbi:MAG: hypothetical protein LBJ70_02000 [Holosporales bacterium]|jgi:hypothetical protein|nr:hypothetical protein [Holosporales bacterium]